MAKQIEDIILRLKQEGFENIDKIKGSFRELNKVTGFTEKDITSVRDALFDFAKTAGNTEAVNKGLISAFQGLRTQADLCGAAYTELSRDIADLEAASRGYTAQAVAQRASLSAQYGAITNNTEALRRQRTALIELQQATRGGSQLFTQLGTDIQRTTTRLEEIEGIQRRTNATLNRGLPSSSAKIRRDLQDVRDRISLEQAELERLQTLTAAERRQFSQGTELRGQSGVTQAIAEQERILATFRQQAGALDLSENVRQRRQAVRDANALFMSPDFTGTGSRTAEGLTRSFGDLPNTLAGINQGLSELRNRLDNTTIGTTAFTDAAIRAAAAQRELRDATKGVAAAFVQQLSTGDIAPSLTNLREVIASVRTEQGLLDTSTSNDARAFRLLELQARSLERQLSALQTTQASLAATPASGFAAFSQSITPQEGDKAVQGSIRRNRGYQERERVRLEREFVASLTDFEASYAGALDNLLSAKLNFRQQEAKQLELADAKEEEAHQAQMARIRAEAAAEEQQFKREMQRLDLLAQQQKAAASALGLGGRELSPLYQGITNLASASVRREQSMMGRSATQVLTDVFTAFDKGGRDVNIRQKSTQIGESIAQGITAGAVDAKTLNSGANKLSLDFITALSGGRGGRTGTPPPAAAPIPPSAPSEYDKLTAAVTRFGSVSKRSTEDLREFSSSLRGLQDILSPTAADFKQVNQIIEQHGQLVDRELEKRQNRGTKRLSGMQIAQGVGAALSGGIFGGPEGLIGGLGGLAVGGVGGAFAGAAFGAQVGIFRQQLAGVTEYSAGIDKLQIALRGIVGSQEAYNQALAAAASVTRDLNIPQETAIQGMTRLSAAVLGAGGKVSDSAFAFRAINEAVKATGGNAEQADGALLALTQVFSKGKVSAEELNQIAERLPGTFTLFAKAAGMTGPELQKALQQGQVGLNDLMKFLQLISSEYGQTALKIAASSQEAGARLSVAFKNMQLEVGRALQPVGASLQSAFADFITKITPAVVAAMKGLAAAFEFLIENKTASGLATFALQLGAVTTGLLALRSAMASLAAVNLAAFFTGTATSAKITGDVMATTALSAGGLTTKIAGLAAVAARPIVITIVIAGVLEALKRLGDVRAAFDDFKKATGQTSGPAWLKDMGGSALNRSQLSKLAADTSAAYNFNVSEVKRLEQQKLSVETQMYAVDDNVSAAALNQQLVAISAKITAAQTRVKSTKANLDAIYKALQQPGVSTAYTPTNLPTAPSDDKDKAKQAADKVAREDQAAAAEQQRLANTLLDQQLRAADRVFQHQIELDRQRYELQKRLDDTQAQNRILRETGVARDVVSNFEDLQRSLRDIEERRTAAAENVRLAKQAQQSAAIRATFEGQGAAKLSGTAGFIAKTGSTGDSTGPHLDARWADGRRITAQDVDRYLSINGRNPSSFGVTSPYGPRQLFGRSFHGGIDLGTPAGSGIALKSGASLLRDLGFTGAGGYAVEIDTPEGRMRLLHLQAGSAKLPKGAATQQNRAIQAAGKAGIESLDVNQAESLQKLIDDNAAKERAAVLEQFTLKATEALREQNATMRDSNALQVLRNRLTLEGVSPERISLEEDLLRISQKQNEAQQTYLKLVAQKPELAGKLTEVLAGINEQYAEQARLLRENAAASDNAIANRIGQLRQQRNELTDIQKVAVSMSQTVESSLSTAISSAVTNLVTGAQTIKQTLAEMFSSIAKAFIDMAAQIIAKQLVIIALNTLAKVFGSSGSSGSFTADATPLADTNWGGGSGGIFGNLGGTDWAQIPSINETIPMPGFANGGIMTSTGPLPLRRYAAGGVANSPQMAVFGERGPEAYVPLPDGRSIPVKMRQRTEALNRYKPISATGTIAAVGDPAAVGGAGNPAAGGPIDVRYSVERINNVEYVTAEQFRNGMQQAAAQGAQRGEQRALRSLQQSTAVRSRVGMR
jgi:tape measure domain-containing protein